MYSPKKILRRREEDAQEIIGMIKEPNEDRINLFGYNPGTAFSKIGEDVIYAARFFPDSWEGKSFIDFDTSLVKTFTKRISLGGIYYIETEVIDASRKIVFDDFRSLEDLALIETEKLVIENRGCDVFTQVFKSSPIDMGTSEETFFNASIRDKSYTRFNHFSIERYKLNQNL